MVPAPAAGVCLAPGRDAVVAVAARHGAAHHGRQRFPLTRAPDAPLLRPKAKPSAPLLLTTASIIMVDRITTVRRDRVGQVVLLGIG